MAETELPPMAPGGEWLHDGSHRAPLYVVHEAHAKRLLSEGWRPTHDPRRPEVVPPVDTSKEDDLAAQLAAALERIKALEEGTEEVPGTAEAKQTVRKAKG